MEDHNDPHNSDDSDPQNADTNSFSAATRLGPNRNDSAPKRTAQGRKTREKLQVLLRTFKPIPFKPSKDLNFTRHVTLLQRLGLWDFVHVEFDSTIVRANLVAQLIASYAPKLRCGYVNGVRVSVNRTQLGRALKLPLVNGEVVDGVLDGLDFVESVGFVEGFLWSWMVLNDDDACEVPNEVLRCEKLIKEGFLEKVDWLGLMWSMVEKELRAPRLGNCYYASHLLHLIKTQHEGLLLEEVEDEEEDWGGDVKIGGVDGLEECNTELGLGQGGAEKVEVEREQVDGGERMDCELNEEEPGQWLFGLKGNVTEPFLRQCNNADVKVLDCEEEKDEEGEGWQEEEQEDEEQEVGWQEQEEEDEEEEEGWQEQDEEDEEEEEEEEHEGGFYLSPKCIPLQGMSSGIDAMEAVPMPLSSGIDLSGNSARDFMPCLDDPQMISGQSPFVNGHKRKLGLDNHNSHLSLNGSNKQPRSDDNQWNAEPVDFDMCMDQMQHWMGIARSMYAMKDQSSEESAMNQQLLLNEIQKRDDMIEHLHKEKVEGNQKICRLEKELHMMTDLLEGYRKALRETQKTFAEYRARCPQADEPIYKDVPESGGLVLSVMELEKQRLKEEVEERINRLVIEKNLRDFERDWIGKLEVHMSSLQSLGNRLLSVEAQVKLLNERNAKSNISDQSECAPSEDKLLSRVQHFISSH